MASIRAAEEIVERLRERLNEFAPDSVPKWGGTRNWYQLDVKDHKFYGVGEWGREKSLPPTNLRGKWRVFGAREKDGVWGILFEGTNPIGPTGHKIKHPIVPVDFEALTDLFDSDDVHSMCTEILRDMDRDGDPSKMPGFITRAVVKGTSREVSEMMIQKINESLELRAKKGEKPGVVVAPTTLTGWAPHPDPKNDFRRIVVPKDSKLEVVKLKYGTGWYGPQGEPKLIMEAILDDILIEVPERHNARIASAASLALEESLAELISAGLSAGESHFRKKARLKKETNKLESISGFGEFA